VQPQPSSNSDWLHTLICAVVTVGFILVRQNLGHRLHPAARMRAWRRLMMPILASAVAGLLLGRFFPNSASLSHDPRMKGLRARERLARSRAILEVVRASARACKKLE
jgi:hypothetical protein